MSFAFQNRPRPLWRVCGDTVWVSKAGEVPSATLVSWWVTAASHVPLTENVKQYRIKTVVFSGQNVLVQILRICCEYIRASLSPVDIRAGRMLLSSLPSHLPGTGNEWRHAGYLNLAHCISCLAHLHCFADSSGGRAGVGHIGCKSRFQSTAPQHQRFGMKSLVPLLIRREPDKLSFVREKGKFVRLNHWLYFNPCLEGESIPKINHAPCQV